MGDRLVVDGWAFGVPARLARSTIQRILLFPALRFVTPVAVRGAERVRTGPYIVVANHVSHLDTPVVIRSLPSRIRRRVVVAAAKDYFYRGRLRGGLVSLSLATFPFDRGAGSKESLRQCRGLLDRGWSLLIFPEGTRSPTGELGRIRHGAAVLAAESGVPILPLYVHGLAEVMPKGTRAPLPGGVVVDIGNPIRPGPEDDVAGLHSRLEKALLALSRERPSWGDPGAANGAQGHGRAGG